MRVVRTWMCTLLRPIPMTNGWWMSLSFPLSCLDLTQMNLSNICVLTRATIIPMCMNLSSKNATLPTLIIAADAMNPFLKPVLYQAKPSSPLDVGWLSVLLAGSPNVAVCAPAGPRNLRTGWPLFNSLALTFSCRWLFMDRYLVQNLVDLFVEFVRRDQALGTPGYRTSFGDHKRPGFCGH